MSGVPFEFSQGDRLVLNRVWLSGTSLFDIMHLSKDLIVTEHKKNLKNIPWVQFFGGSGRLLSCL